MCDHDNPNLNRKPKQAVEGARLQDGKAHTKHHTRWSRRGFLGSLGLAGAGSVCLGGLNILSAKASPLMAALNQADGDRILVLVRLKGGNDGLNTIVPLYQYDYYANIRPTLRIPENQLFNLSDELGLSPSLSDTNSLWQEGRMKVLNSVGYADQNLSHFRSSDIWATADLTDESATNGWLGNYFADAYPDYLVNPPTAPPAVQIGQSNIFFGTLNGSQTDLGFSVSDPIELYEIAQNGQLYDVLDVPECYYGDQVSYLRAVTNSTYNYAEAIHEAYQNGANAVEYSPNSLSDQLAMIARLIKGGLGTKIYMVSIGGFDTHAEQAATHDTLLQMVGRGMSDFYADLSANDFGETAGNVLSVTFSEFGRTIEENSTFGTDHGASAPMLFFGGGLDEGPQILGQTASLTDTDNVGNLKHHVDFRSVYATLLESWLCVEPDAVDAVFGQAIERIDGLVKDCQSNQTPTSISALDAAGDFDHWVEFDGGRSILHIELKRDAAVHVEVYNIGGKPVAQLFSGYQAAGRHQLDFSPRAQRLPVGAYVYHIRFDNRETAAGRLMNFGGR